MANRTFEVHFKDGDDVLVTAATWEVTDDLLLFHYEISEGVIERGAYAANWAEVRDVETTVFEGRPEDGLVQIVGL